MKTRGMFTVAFIALSIVFFAGCASQRIVCPLCAEPTIEKHMYTDKGVQLESKCAYCKQCQIGIDTGDTVGKAKEEMIRRRLD